jgi:hypothetical protein
MTEEITQPNEAGQKASEEALQAIKNRSFSGRNPHLGRMISCAICGLRHRENERKCEQKFAVDENKIVYGELKPPEGLTNLTARQLVGAAVFNKRRRKPRQRPIKPMTKWQRILKEAHERKHSDKKSDLGQSEV